MIFFAAKDGEALYSQQKQDWDLTVAQIMNSLLSNSNIVVNKKGSLVYEISSSLVLIPFSQSSSNDIPHSVFLRVPMGCLYMCCIASLGRWWLLPPLAVSRQWVTNAMGISCSSRILKCLVLRCLDGRKPFLCLLWEGSPSIVACATHACKFSLWHSLLTSHMLFCPLPS